MGASPRKRGTANIHSGWANASSPNEWIGPTGLRQGVPQMTPTPEGMFGHAKVDHRAPGTSLGSELVGGKHQSPVRAKKRGR